MLKSALLAAALAISINPAFSQDDTKLVESAYQSWNQAFNAGDASVLAKYYTDDALFLAPDHVVRKGPAGVEEFFGGLFKAGVTGHELKIIEAHSDGDLVYAAANWKAKAKGSDGKMGDIGGVGTHIFEKQDDGSLKLKLHTFN